MDIFISHSGSDKIFADLLKKNLDSKDHECFVAPESINKGEDWQMTIQNRIIHCDLFIFLDSGRSRKSPWVQQEIGMARASGRIIIPISITDSSEDLPGWMGGIQGIQFDTFKNFKEEAPHIADQILKGADKRVSELPARLKSPESIYEHVLRTILLDQIENFGIRSGAWSKQYDRYLAEYYGKKLKRDVSKTATLTFTGTIIDKLNKFVSVNKDWQPITEPLVENGLRFVINSRDKHEGGFGKIGSSEKARGGIGIEMDLRHSCWAIITLLNAGQDRFLDEIEQGIHWIYDRIKKNNERDWCWTTSTVLRLAGFTEVISVLGATSSSFFK